MVRGLLAVARVQERQAAPPLDRGDWPGSIPAVQHVLENGLDLGRATILVGENGSGKSTLVEAIAESYGFAPDGGTHHARLFQTDDPRSPLAAQLELVRSGFTREGVFLRAETMHAHLSYLDQLDKDYGPPDYQHGRNAQSHGESFIDFFTERSSFDGLWVFDEAESALSFQGCLALLAHMRSLLQRGVQILMSTHSPILASLPGADIYELGEWGLRPSAWEDLEMVRNWRSFLGAPERYLRHL